MRDFAGALHEGGAHAVGRRSAPVFLVLPIVAVFTTLLAMAARFFQDIPPPPPVSTMITRVAVQLDSAPSGARISADGTDLGLTPLRSSLPVGVHTIELERDGFEKLRRHIELAPGSPLAASFPLKVRPGRLRLITDLVDAQVTLDGEPLSGSDGDFDADSVAPGRHHLKIEGAKGHGSLAFEITPAGPPVVETPKGANLTIAAISRFGDSGTVVSNDVAKIGLTHAPLVESGPEPKPLAVEPEQHAELMGSGLARRTLPVTHAAVPSVGILAALQSGSLVVIGGAPDFSVWINGKQSERHPVNGRLYFWGLMPGEYSMRIAGPAVGDRSMRVLVEKDKQTAADFTGNGTVARPPQVQRAATAPMVPVKPPVKTAAAKPTAPTVRTPIPPPASVVPRPTPKAPQPTPEQPQVLGLARFVVRTPGARVTIRRVDAHDPLTRVVVVDSLRLPAGRWMVNATAPGYIPWTGYFLVNPAGPADVFIRLTPEENGARSKHSKE